MRVNVVQMFCRQSLVENLERILELMDDVRAEGGDLAVFPQGILCDPEATAAPSDFDGAVEAIREQARTCDINVVVGVSAAVIDASHNQALTALWGRDVKDVLDDKLFRKIGIRPERWDWVTGREVFENKNFYPNMPGYGDFIDPPYEVDDHVVRGGGGWAVMSASDLARYGLLVASGGVWAGERLLDAQWVHSHGGGNGSRLEGDPATFLSMGMVTTQGLPSLKDFAELVTGPVRVER